MATMLPPDNRPTEDVDEDLSLAELIEKVREFGRITWRDRRYIWRSLALTVSLGLVIAFGSTPEYTASTKILPYHSASSSSPLSSLSGLAGLVGARLPTATAGEIITAELYPEVANTLDYRISVAETPIRFSTLEKPISTIKYFRDVSRPSVVDLIRRYSVDLPGRVLSAIHPAAELMVAPDSGNGLTPLPHYDLQYLKIVRGLEERLTVDISRKTGVITIQGTLPDAYAAADLVRTASERLMERIISFDARKAGEQLIFAKDEQKRSRERFERVQQQMASSTDRNRGTKSATAQIESQRLQSEYNLTFDSYRQFSAEYEQARIKQNEDTPVFTVLEQVVVPNGRVRPRRALILLGACFFGVVAGMALIGWRRIQYGSGAVS
jgi:hypothetical protein